MQTSFTPDQLKDKHNAEAEQIIRKCVHCGLCTASCSSYVITGDERDSPRGRIYMIKGLLEHDAPVSSKLTGHLDNCLSCLSCMSACPSRVDYMHLIDLARIRIEKTNKRPVHKRLLRTFLARVMPDPALFRTLMRFAQVTRPVHGVALKLAEILRLPELAAMIKLTPKSIPSAGRHGAPGVYTAKGKRIARVALLPGCVQRVIRPAINDAVVRLLTRHGVEVVIPQGINCCGAMEQHMGRETRAKRTAKRVVDAISEVLRADKLDAIVISASGCGTTVKDYGHLLADEPGYAKRAEKVADLARDISEILGGLEMNAPVQWSDLRVAYHSACSMQHGQQLRDEPVDALKTAGYNVLAVPEGHLCCGSAGVYNILQPKIADELRDRKVKNIMSTEPDVIATGNIGCMAQLAPALDVPIVHTIELVDWANGGPCPPELKKLQSRVHKVSEIQGR